MQSNSYTYITTIAVAGAVTSVSSDACTLKRIIVGDVATAYTIGIVNNITGSTVNVGTIKTVASTGTTSKSYNFDCRLGSGLRIVTTGAVTTQPYITVVWNT
jgi:hypothetical protein